MTKYYDWDCHKFITKDELEKHKKLNHEISEYDVPEDSKIHLYKNRTTLCGEGDTPNLTVDESHVTCEKCIELMKNKEINESEMQ